MKFLSSFILLILFAIKSTILGQAPTATPTIADFFSRAPIDIASGLPEYSRLDMIDYYNHGSSVKTENRLGQKVLLRSLTPEKLVYQDDDSITTTMAVLPYAMSSNADTLIIVIRTAPMPMRDSRIFFFDKQWRPVSGKGFPDQSLKDWLITDNRALRLEIENVLPFMISTADYDPATATLIFTNNIREFFAPNSMPQVLDNLKKQLKYNWDGHRFYKIKDE